MQNYERKEQAERNGQRDNHRGTDAEQEKEQHNHNQNHAPDQVAFHGVGSELYQIAAIVKRTDLYIFGQDGTVEFVRLLFHRFENVLGLLIAAHQDDAFNGVVVVGMVGLKAELSQPRSVPDGDFAHIAYTDGSSFIARDNDVGDVVAG